MTAAIGFTLVAVKMTKKEADKRLKMFAKETILF